MTTKTNSIAPVTKPTYRTQQDRLRDEQIIGLLRQAHLKLLLADALYLNHYKTRMVSKADIAEDTDGLSLDLCGTIENLINQLTVETELAKLAD